MLTYKTYKDLINKIRFLDKLEEKRRNAMFILCFSGGALAIIVLFIWCCCIGSFTCLTSELFVGSVLTPLGALILSSYEKDTAYKRRDKATDFILKNIDGKTPDIANYKMGDDNRNDDHYIDFDYMKKSIESLFDQKLKNEGYE